MDYRQSGNNPNQEHEYPTPDEVRVRIMGDSTRSSHGPASTLQEAFGQLADDAMTTSRDLASLLGAGPTEEELTERRDEIMVWLGDERTMAESRLLGAREGRCPTCGRKFMCVCQGCPVCPQRKMADGKVCATWAKAQVALGGTDPREMC